ncbi:MAG: patatin-like phospholipase family protein [Nitratireductor sp.]|nr:patatin-like phospholipase family protein [Nitratireductor sp.]
MRPVFALLASLLLAACSTTSTSEYAAPIAPARSYDLVALRQSSVLSDPAMRFFPASNPDMARVTGWALAGLPELPDGTFDMLALSSGGPDGAFGVGVLNGMSDTGTRPKFEVVTGVSTGALIAPFAFLGSKSDPVLKELYTGKQLQGLVGTPNFFRAMAGGALYEPEKLRRLIDRLVTRDMLSEIGREYRKGRRLYVATANLDADELTVWDMSRIASKGDEASANLFKKVLEAAVSIPGAFAPIEIVANTPSGPITELHGDGAVLANFYADPAIVPAPLRPKSEITVIVHNQLRPKPQPQKASLVPLVKKSVSALSRSSTRLLLQTTRLEARQRGIAMRYASLPDDWPSVSALDIDRKYMQKTFDYGYQAARAGGVWQNREP